MDKERIDDLVDILGDEFAKVENTFIIKNNRQLGTFIEEPETWGSKQLKIKNKYKKDLIEIAKEQVKRMNKITENVMLLSYREVDKEAIKIEKGKIIARGIPKSYRKKIAEAKHNNLEQVVALANLGLASFVSSVKTIISQTKFTQKFSGGSASDFKKPSYKTKYEEMAEEFRNVVRRQMKVGISKGLKVQYKDGKQMSWRAYMEMNIRTSLQHEAGEEQIHSGARVGQIFYACNYFSDAAPDHAPLQGKIYFNKEAKIPQDVMDWIKSHNIMSMQEAREEPYWLTTRPNCRHTFHAIPLEEAMGMSAKAIINKYDLSNGAYKESNYKKRMQQRYNERMIRKYKLRKESNEEAAKSMKDTPLYDARKDNALIRKWQKTNRELIKSSHGVLKRERERENIKILARDLGVQYEK